MNDTPAILAHRGASADHPENTVRAVLAALSGRYAADGFEVDVRLTTDGVPVVFHDDDTQRLTGSPGGVEDRTLEDVRRLRVGGEPIPTLAELLDALPAVPDGARARLVNIELKPVSSPVPLIAACRPLLDPLAERSDTELVVSSFDPRVLEAAREAGAPWRRAFLYEIADALVFASTLATDGKLDLHPDAKLVDAAHAQDARRGEFGARATALRVWTVDDPSRARELAALGVDAIITNRPALLIKALRGDGP